MSDQTDLDEGSVVEYSLAELGFVLVFVLLLLSGWEINTNAEKLKEEARTLADLERQLKAAEEENKTLQIAISKTVSEEPDFRDDFQFVDKKEYLALQAKAEASELFFATIAPAIKSLEPSVLEAITAVASATETPPDDPIIVSKSDQNSLEQNKNKLEQENRQLKEQLAAISQDPEPADRNGGRIGTVGFCTYLPPRAGDSKVYGRSVAIGTLIVGQDSLTLIDKNSALTNGSFVDIAGDPYDTTRVAKTLEDWPLHRKMTRKEFQAMGAKFMEIGRAPSEKRVGCRFGMDYFIPVVNERSLTYLEKQGLQGSFFKNSRLSEQEFMSRFPKYSQALSLQDNAIIPILDSQKNQRGQEQKKISSSNNRATGSRGITLNDSTSRTPVQILSRATPIFPKRAERRGVSGLTEVIYKVSINGLATEIQIIKEEPQGEGFGAAAIAALKKYKFKPAMIDGEPVESNSRRLRFRF